MEQWCLISGYRIYEISDQGRIRNIKTGKILTPQKDKYGYKVIHLRDIGNKLAKVHRLVAKAFCLNPKNSPMVNHKDGDKTNNFAYNLEWVSAKENHTHAYKTGLLTFAYGNRAWGCKLKEEDIPKIKELYKTKTQQEIAKIFSISQTQVGRIIRGVRWKHLTSSNAV